MILILVIIVVLCIFLSGNQITNLNKFLNKFKKIQNLVILLFSIISVFNYKKFLNLPNIVGENKINKSKRTSVTQSIKKLIASNQKWNCNICKNTLDHTYEVDHILPLFKGGSNKSDNLQALCRNCHGKKTFNDLN